MAEENDETQENTEAGEAKPKKKFSALTMLVLGQTVLTLAFGGAVVIGLKSMNKTHLTEDTMKERAIASVRDEVDKIQWIALDPFITNTRTQATIKASFNIEISDTQTANALKSRMPAVRARILNLLSQQDAHALRKMQEKLLLKDALREVINLELQKAGIHDGVVRDVYLLDLIII